MRKNLYLLFVMLLICSCSGVKYKVNDSKYKAVSYNERVRFIIVHYTALNDERSIKALTTHKVSSHYLITQKEDDDVYSIVPDTLRAWHAGVSYFDGYKNLNDNSIGIEISNLGYSSTNREKVKALSRGEIDRNIFYAFNEAQIYKVAMLITELQQKYKVNPRFILGHSDIAPTRKLDPGPKFPWKYLYDRYGLGAWYNAEDYQRYYSPTLFASYSVKDLKNEFKKYGYEINDTDEWDLKSKKTVAAFQMHFRPQRIDGVVDLETFAIIKALNKKYVGR